MRDFLRLTRFVPGQKTSGHGLAVMVGGAFCDAQNFCYDCGSGKFPRPSAPLSGVQRVRYDAIEQIALRLAGADTPQSIQDVVVRQVAYEIRLCRKRGFRRDENASWAGEVNVHYDAVVTLGLEGCLRLPCVPAAHHE